MTTLDLGLMALDGGDKPWLVTGGGGCRGRRPLVSLLSLGLGPRLASNGTVPLRDPAKVEIKVTKKSFLVI